MDGESLPDNDDETVQEYFAEVLESYVIAEHSA
jgi:hypothetical protein